MERGMGRRRSAPPTPYKSSADPISPRGRRIEGAEGV